MKKFFRRLVSSRQLEDSQTISNLEYNPQSGSQKNIEVGPSLKYLDNTAAAVRVTQGSQLFLFKTTTGLDYVTLGENSSITKGTAPSEDTFPVFGQQYTRISAAQYKYIIGTADIHVYVLEDDSVFRENAN